MADDVGARLMPRDGNEDGDAAPVVNADRERSGS